MGIYNCLFYAEIYIKELTLNLNTADCHFIIRILLQEEIHSDLKYNIKQIYYRELAYKKS